MIVGSISAGWRTIREIIRNAVIHRDYSLSGKDIKIAIFDDKIEVTSPGKLMPTIDFDDMESGQSDIRNKILAPVFKRLGIIEQWGNGLRLIAKELDDYPEIELSWKEPGISFRITFLKKDYTQPSEYDWEAVVSEVGTKLGLSWDQVGAKLEPGWQEVRKLLQSCIVPQPLQNLIKLYNWTNRTKFRNKYINPLLETGLLMMTIPDKPTSSKQKYILTDKGLSFLDFLETKI